MEESSARYGLPFIIPGQAQKELFHNEALTLLDAALHPAVEGAPIASPPSTLELGRCWLVAAGGHGIWAGHDGALAAWTAGGWRFLNPQIGMTVWDKSNAFVRRWTGSVWTDGELAATAVHIAGLKVLGPRQPAIANPAAGTSIDQEARAAIDAIIVSLKAHGLIE